jgi:hypothetical protein
MSEDYFPTGASSTSQAKPSPEPEVYQTFSTPGAFELRIVKG